MPSKSQSQQRFFGMINAYKKGKLKDPSEKIKEVSKHISAEDTKHFAKTKHKGLPEKVEKKSLWDELLKTSNSTVLKAHEKVKEQSKAKKVKPISSHTTSKSDPKKQVVVYNPDQAHNNFSKTVKSPKTNSLWNVIKKNPIKTTVVGAGTLGVGAYALSKKHEKKSLWKEIGESLVDAPGRIAEFIPGLGYKTPYTQEAERMGVPHKIEQLHKSMMSQAEGLPYEESENIRRATQDQIQQLHEQNPHHQRYDNAGWGATGLGVAGTLGGAGLYDAITKQPKQPQEQPMQQKYSLWKEAVRGDMIREGDQKWRNKINESGNSDKIYPPEDFKNDGIYARRHPGKLNRNDSKDRYTHDLVKMVRNNRKKRTNEFPYSRAPKTSPSASPEAQQSIPKPLKGFWNIIKRNPIKTTAVGVGALGLAGAGAYALKHQKSKHEPQEKKALLGAAIEGLNMVGVPMMAYKALRQFGAPLKNYFPEVEGKSFWQSPLKKSVRGIGQGIYKDDMIPSVASGIAPMLTMPLADYAANLVDPQPPQPQEQQY